MDLLPPEADEDVSWAMGELNARKRTQEDIRGELNERLEAKGLDGISSSAFNRRSMRLASHNRRLAEARAVFEGLAPQFTAEKVDDTNLVIGELIKTLILEMLDSSAEDFSPKGAMEISRAWLSVIQGQKLSTERRAKAVAEFARKTEEGIEKVAKAKGLSVETVAKLKREILGVRED